MDVYKIAGLAVITALLSLTVRSIRPEMGMQVALAGGLIILGFAVSEFSGAAELLRGFAEKTGIESGIVGVMVKILGTAYVTEAASGICRDAGENALAVKTEICGRLMLMSAALPWLLSLASSLLRLVEEGF
ncbi:MAG: hypothetical protein IKQ36_10265 [Clostridia bacterium]|nr:hypothetical protein [Clostridia bacterium]